jgi:PAS domain S-box-containing protein
VNKIRILIVEDLSTDAELARREIDKELGLCEYRIVEQEEEFLEALDRFDPDLVISDYMLPRFNGMKALKLMVEKRPGVPFIVFTGSMNEDTAVACMKAGAWDYVIKEHIKRLGPAVRSALVEKKNRAEKTKIQEALLRAGKEWRTTFDAMNDAVCVTDIHGTILRANSAFRKLTGKPWDTVIGGKCHTVLRETECIDKKCPLSRVKKTGKRHELEVFLHERWFRSIADPVFDENGAVIEVIHILSNITEIKETQNELKEKISELRTVELQLQQRTSWLNAFNSLTREIARKNTLESVLQVATGYLERAFQFLFSWILIEEKDHKTNTIHGVSSRGRELAEELGITPGAEVPLRELLRSLRYEPSSSGTSLNVEELKGRADSEQVRNLMGNLLSRGVGGLIFIPMRIQRERTGAIIMASSKPLELNEDEWNFLHDMAEYVALSAQNWSLYRELESSYRELTEARKMNMEQERLRAIGQIASGIAHDINNTLAPITLYTEALLDTEPNLSERAERYLKTIQKSIGDIEKVVTRLRAFYRKNEGQEKEQILVEDLFNDVIAMSRPRWKDMPNKKGIRVECGRDVQANLPSLFGNTSEIREALINLVFNAVDALPGGGTITLKAYQREHSTVLEVTDTGTGMEEEVKKRSLEPFFTTKGGKGTGLGLPGVYGMIKRHGGEIVINSAPEEGTTVQLSFPADTASREEKPAPINTDSPVRPARILVIDDDERVLAVLKEMLTLEGHEIITGASGEEGLELFNRDISAGEGINCVITDLGMPGMDGIEVGKKIKMVSPNTPVILLTGWGAFMEEEKPEYVDRVLSKPPTMEELRAAIEAVM